MKTVWRRQFLAGLLPAFVLGCKASHPFSAADVDRARRALDTALEGWKKGDMPEKLRALPEPIEFSEEWPKSGLRLLEFQVLGSEHTDAEAIRFSVTLTVQDRRGKREERKVTYAVGLKGPIVIGRDPFF